MSTDTETALARLRPNGTPARVSQGTAIEQSRAIAQVQAMVIVAQQCPRSVQLAIEAMEEACRQKELADRAFFRFPRGKDENGRAVTVSGPSVHLARELARCWGNIEHGVTELRRDDHAAESEMQAFAWDLQTNTRSASIFIVPHRRDTKSGVRDLTDMRDIYENNANNGARRLREAIFSVLPVWYREKAMELCTQTLADGGGKPLATRIADAVKAFERFRVSGARIAAKFGVSSADELTAADVGQLGVIYESLKQGTVTVDEEFPAEPDRITAADITGQPAQQPKPAQRGRRTPKDAASGETDTPPSRSPEAAPGGDERPPALITTGQKSQLETLRGKLGDGDSEQDWEQWLSDLARLAGLGVPIASPLELTQDEAKRVIDQLRALKDRKALRDLLRDGVKAAGDAADGEATGGQ